MKAWYSGLIPYPVLLPVQVVILCLQARITIDLARGRGWFSMGRRRAGRPLRRFSCVYFAAMTLRYPVSRALAPGAPWFQGLIPIFFHWVLGAYLFILSGWHLRVLREGPGVGR
jgi:hypothetical protein